MDIKAISERCSKNVGDQYAQRFSDSTMTAAELIATDPEIDESPEDFLEACRLALEEGLLAGDDKALAERLVSEEN